ncbi:MAG TPA: fumarylacetoacetate hydrolase family protein [Polyangiaceae bacterium]|nr:fumarylacetoacetate hydrolase family protein [Polyangiaceae bacterium]
MPPVRFARVSVNGAAHFAEVHGDSLALLDGPPWDGGARTGTSVPAAGAPLLCPVTPRKILGIGRNYRAHANEMGGDVPAEPLVFSKAVTSLVGPGGTVLLPKESARVDYEGELGVVIGRRARRVSREQAMEHVFGVVPVCDVTARDLQKKDGQWTRAKGFDTFCPAGPHVVTGLDASSLGVVLAVNGALKQSGNTRDMVFGIDELVAYLSRFLTLEPGDLVATGTPEGVGPLTAGDVVEVTVESAGTLRFGVARED